MVGVQFKVLYPNESWNSIALRDHSILGTWLSLRMKSDLCHLCAYRKVVLSQVNDTVMYH